VRLCLVLLRGLTWLLFRHLWLRLALRLSSRLLGGHVGLLAAERRLRRFRGIRIHLSLRRAMRTRLAVQ
jgi:hypothetical protein